MRERIKVMTIFGTRPEAIKMAPLVLELRRRPEFDCLVCVTAQHREMLDQVMKIFGLKADYDLDIMEPGQSLSKIMTKSLAGLDDVFVREEPDMVLVHGDTSTTLAGALAAFYHKVSVGHVEAGLRTYDRYSPFPEEMNRTLTGDLAAYHFAPTERNRRNLEKEGITENVFVTGNTVIDALSETVRDDYIFRDKTLRNFDFNGKKVILVTAHRRENYGRPLENIMRSIKDVVEAVPDAYAIYPVHMSPVVREAAERNLGGLDRVLLTDPFTVDDMHNLMARSHIIMTDSGGLQEEAPALGKPVLVLRRETERPEAVEAGTVKIAGVEHETITQMALTLLNDENEYDKMSRAVNPYGDGKASSRIADAILYGFGKRSEPPENFSAD